MNGSCGVKVIMQQAYSLIGEVSKKHDHNVTTRNPTFCIMKYKVMISLTKRGQLQEHKENRLE